MTTYVFREHELERHVLDVAKIALDQLGLGACSRSFEVVTHDDLGAAELTVRVKLTWPARVLFGWCWPRLVELKIREIHAVTSYSDVVLAVAVRADLP